jgi:hypothetical protein
MTPMRVEPASNDLQSLTAALPDRTVKALANSIFRNLRHEGCQAKDIISVSTQLLSLVSGELSNEKASNT